MYHNKQYTILCGLGRLVAPCAATLLALSIVVAPLRAAGGQDASTLSAHPTLYKTVKLGDLDVFYREAGPKDAPTILLLHGFPTSSNMFRNLIPRLATSFHAVAPD